MTTINTPAAAVPRSAHAPGEEHPGGSRGGPDPKEQTMTDDDLD